MTEVVQRVYITYPEVEEPEDGPWLRALVLRHHGELLPDVMLSLPSQRVATFTTMSEAEAFSSDVRSEDRWQARIIA